MPLPPLPQGFTLQSGTAPPPDPNLLKPLFDAGVVPTNGYRTPADIQRLRAQGYSPASNSLHLNGDAVDLTPGTSGLSFQQLQDRAQAIASRWPNGRVLNEGDHIHLQLPGWGMAPGTPGTPNAGIPPLPPGATLVQRGSLQAGPGMFASPATPLRAALSASTALTPVTLTGQAHDGDTVRLTNGSNGRLYGFDAFELNQTGRNASGQTVPLGVHARDFMLSQIAPGISAFPTGASTYGRPVINLSQDPFRDPAYSSLLRGYGIAEPQYLQGSSRFPIYMDAERQARMNSEGGFQTDAVTPSEFRHNQEPFLTPQPGVSGQPGSVAVFKDEPMPFTGYRPEVEKALISIWQDPKGTPEQYIEAGEQFGLTFDPTAVSKKFASRFDAHGNLKSGALGSKLPDPTEQPRPLIDKGDGAAGAFARGVGDPFNALDEIGAVTDSLGIGMDGPRINIWNAPKGTRFGDIFATNEEQNREILAHDEAFHPYARTAGQLTSGVAVPMGIAKTPIQLAGIMAAQGGLSGFMSGEGGLTSRLPSAALGTVEGALAGPILYGAGKYVVGPLVNKGANLLFRRGATDALPPLPEGFAVEPSTTAQSETAPVPASTNGVPPIAPEMLQRINGGFSVSGEPLPPVPDGFHLQPSSAAMAADRGPEIVGPVVGGAPADLPPLPEGFNLTAPFGVTRNANERLSPQEMAALAEGVNPASVLPRPASDIGSLDESITASPGRFQQLEAPDEFQQLGVRTVTTANGGKVRVRGPLDLTQSVRLMGGVRDEGGELAHAGITNEARRMPFGSNEQFLGKLVNNDSGRSIEDVAHSLWEEGYFPGLKEPPTADDLVQALKDEQFGQRHFHPNDLPEVADFNAAQSERGRIGEAEASGSPLVDERGSTINLDDLVANTPPTTAYEDTPRLTGKIGNINLGRLEKPGDVAQLIDQVASRVGGFDAASRGQVTNEETQHLAQEMGVRPEQLLKRQQRQALNAEQLYASRALVQRSRENVVRLAQKAIGGSDDDLAAFRKAWLLHAALEEQIAGATAEAGRALQQFKMLASAKDANGDAVRSYLRGGGGRDSIEDAARAIVDLSADPAKANRFIADSVKPTWKDKFNELWVNSLLSGPRTHVVNFVGNAVTTAMMLPEQAVTAGIGALTRSADRTTIGEVSARLHGMVNGALEGLQALKSSAGDMVTNPGAWLANEHGPADMATKVENARFHAIDGRKGQIIRLPTRALTAADEFWKSINRNAELHALAYREATKTARDPKAWDSTYERLLQSPTEDMQNQANEAARYYTFQKELGPTGKLVTQLSNANPLGKILIPFVKTPTNLIKFAGERSVFGPLMPSVRSALLSGGRARDEALARITLGSGLSTAAVLGALQGRVSGGGPTDPGERAALLQSGWQPYSFRIGNKWVSYSRLDPYSTLFGVAADLAEAGNWATKKEADQIALKLTESIAQNITNKTWLSGLSDTFDVLSDPQRYGGRYVQNLAASMAVPAISSQTAQAMDPNMRSARNIVDAIKARVPIVSQSVPVRRNVWGDPVAAGGSIGPKILSPFYASTVDPSPFSQEIARLRAPLTIAPRNVVVNGKHVPLSSQQYDEFVQLAGKPAKAAIVQQMASPDWRRMSDDDKRDEIKSILSDMRDNARDEMRQRYPQLAGQDGFSATAFPPATSLPPVPQGFQLAR